MDHWRGRYEQLRAVAAVMEGICPVALDAPHLLNDKGQCVSGLAFTIRTEHIDLEERGGGPYVVMQVYDRLGREKGGIRVHMKELELLQLAQRTEQAERPERLTAP